MFMRCSSPFSLHSISFRTVSVLVGLQVFTWLPYSALIVIELLGPGWNHFTTASLKVRDNPWPKLYFCAIKNIY